MDIYLGFDVGTKRIGVAIGNNLTFYSHPLTTIKNYKDGKINWEDIDKILQHHKIKKIIVGLPFNIDGSVQQMTFFAKSFAKKIKKKFNIKVILIDEFLSSFEAKKQLKYNHSHKNADRADIDKKSAQIILQDYLNDLQTIKK